MDKVSRPYRDGLLKALTDPVEAVEYLNAAIEDGDVELFLMAVRDIAEAHRLKKENDRDISLSDLPFILSATGLRFTMLPGCYPD